MNPMNDTHIRTKGLLLGGCGLLMIFGTACSQPPAVNPWVDDSIPASEWSTPSRDGVLAAHRPMQMRTRKDAVEKQGPYVSRDVPHYPLYWEDPFTDKGDGDDLYAWTYADYLAIPYVHGRFILNTIGTPVSLIVHPPGTSMVSDGKIGRDHDTLVGHSPNPTASASDFGYELSDEETSELDTAHPDTPTETDGESSGE